MKILLIGAPGAGKGTQAANISKWYNIPTISTGDIIRQHMKSGSELGQKVKSYMDSGNLVPDNIVIDIIKERLGEDDCKSGFILDGFPRTIEQVKALEKIENIKVVISIEVEDSVIVQRLSGRRVCMKCKTSYHIESKKPLIDGICDTCGEKLVTRDDDKYETVLKRLAVYHKQTEPIKDYYEKSGILFRVSGREDLSETTAAVKQILENLRYD